MEWIDLMKILTYCEYVSERERGADYEEISRYEKEENGNRALAAAENTINGISLIESGYKGALTVQTSTFSVHLLMLLVFSIV